MCSMLHNQVELLFYFGVALLRYYEGGLNLNNVSKCWSNMIDDSKCELVFNIDFMIILAMCKEKWKLS